MGCYHSIKSAYGLTDGLWLFLETSDGFPIRFKSVSL